MTSGDLNLADLIDGWAELFRCEAASSSAPLPSRPAELLKGLLPRSLVRRTLRWPAWIDVWFTVCSTPGHLHRGDMVAALHGGHVATWLRLALGQDKDALALAARMERSALLVTKAFATDDRDRLIEILNAEEALLLEAVIQGTGSVGRRPALNAELELPVLVVDRAGDGKVLLLRLGATPVTPGDPSQCRFVRAPGSHLLHATDTWQKGLDRAAEAVRTRLVGEAWPPVALVWDLLPKDDLNLVEVDGDSASAAFALGALGLLRRRGHAVQPDLAQWLLRIDWSRAVVTASIRGPSGKLGGVGGLPEKLRRWMDQARANAVAGKVFVSRIDDGRLRNDGQGDRLEPCADLFDLAMKVAAHTDESLDKDLAELRQWLQKPDDEGLPPRELIERCAATRPRPGLQSWLLWRWAQLAHQDDGTLQHRFVNLQLASRRPDHHPADKPEPYHSLRQMLQAHPAENAWLVTGMPGAGKTTMLAHHEMACAREAIRSLVAGELPHEICVHVPLAGYPLAQVDAMAWLQEWWSRHGIDHTPLQQLLEERGRSIRLLFDALNEISADDPLQPVDERSQLIAARRLARWAQERRGAMKPPVFSVRELDRMLIGSNQFRVQHAEVLPWDNDQQEQYCLQRLPGGQGQALWHELQRYPDRHVRQQLKELLALPMNLSFQAQLYQDIGRLALSRAELFSAITWQRLRREFGADRLWHEGLLGTRDLEALAAGSDAWKARLLHLPVDGVLVRELDRQGFRQLSAGSGNVRRVKWDTVATDLQPPGLRQAWLKAVQDLGLARQVDGDEFEFVHQLWGEFFAARWMARAAAEPGFQLPPGIVQPAPDKGLEQALAAAEAADQPLAPLKPSPWEEAVKMAVQLAWQPSALVDAVRTVNPVLAARAAASARAPVEAPVLQPLRQALLVTCRTHADLRFRVQAGVALGDVEDTLRFERRQGQHAPFLMARPAHWVAVAPGRYLIGSVADDLIAFDDEKPAVPVELAGFEMAAFPVTNAEWRCFMEAGGYQDPQWWGGGDSLRWLHRPGRRQGPSMWGDPRSANSLAPVTGIGLWEAHAYCRWLTRQAASAEGPGMCYRLPVEAEWEAAARGPGRLTYPWGEQEPDADRCNAWAARLGAPSPVGAFPSGDRVVEGTEGESRLCDLVGNACEWTSSRYTVVPEPHALLTALDDAHGGRVKRAVRGSGWVGFTARELRAARRFGLPPTGDVAGIGMRLVRVRVTHGLAAS